MRRFIGIHTHKKEEVLERVGGKGYKIVMKEIENKNFKEYEKYGMLPCEDDIDFNRDYTQVKVFYKDNQERESIFRNMGLEVSSLSYIHYKFDKKKTFSYQTKYKIDNKYPIYIISKNRYQENRHLTVTYMEESHINYYLCVLENERNEYQSMLDRNHYTHCIKILSINSNYDMGGIPQRNKCWEHARENNHEKHWVVDDNIRRYYYFNRLQRIPIHSGVVFRCIEDMVDNIQENIAISGHNYRNDVKQCEMKKPFQLNNKVYSSILVNNKLLDQYNIHWRLKYNEDVDICINCIKHGLYTLATNQVLADKQATGSIQGGNQDIYKNFTEKGYQDKLDALLDTHPDCVKGVEKFGRPHHFVDYKKISIHHKESLTVKETRSWNHYNLELVTSS
jgi:hypothetical protein